MDPTPVSFIVVSSNKHFERFFYECILGNLVYLYLFIMILKRYIKNREIADLRKKKLTQSIKNKMFLITLLAFLNLLMILASYNWHGFWLYDIQNYSLLYIFQIFVLIVQIRMMKFEFMKTIPYTWYLHHLFWILLTILHVLYLLNTLLIQCENLLDVECLTPNLLFDILRLAASGVLTLYNLVFKFQDLPDFEMIWSSNTKAVEINSNNNNFETLSKPFIVPIPEQPEDRKQPKALRFKVNIKNKLINNNNRVYYQINLELSTQKSVKVFKTIEDFMKLDQNIQEIKASLLFSGNNPALPKLNFQKPTQNTVFSSEFFLDQKGLFENYLKVFLENELFPLALVEFLEIKEPFKTKCIQSFHQKFILKNNPQFENFEQNNEEEKEERNVSVSSVVLTDNNILPNEEIFRPPENEKDADFVKKRFCVYFNVQMQEWVKESKHDYFSFIFQFSLVEKPEEVWKINKRYSDFIRLDQELKKVLKRNLPELPEKKLLLDSDILNKRGKKLAKYLRTLLNEKVYFNNILFEFIKLNNENFEILMNTQIDLEPKLYQAFTIEHTVIIDNEDKQPYTGYIIRIVKYEDLAEKKIEKEHKIIKRFSDFERLHKILAVRFRNTKNFPNFPSKIPSFSAGETINYRKNALEKYLNELFKIENIEDSVGFRKFLNVDGKEKGNFIMNVSNVENEAMANSEKFENFN